jgi:hypothetical protein
MYSLNASLLITSLIDEHWTNITLICNKINGIKITIDNSFPIFNFSNSNSKHKSSPSKHITLTTIPFSNINTFILDPDNFTIRIHTKSSSNTLTDGYYLIKFNERNQIDYNTFIQFITDIKSSFKHIKIEYRTKQQDNIYHRYSFNANVSTSF